MRILDKEHYIVPETQKIGALTIGPANYESSNSIDYPLPSNISIEYTYFFLKIFLKFLNYSSFNNLNSFYTYDLPKKEKHKYKSKINKVEL